MKDLFVKFAETSILASDLRQDIMDSPYEEVDLEREYEKCQMLLRKLEPEVRKELKLRPKA
jgi:hypothetical protein